MPDDKREHRKAKREIKRRGSQYRRRMLKRALAEHPEEAADDVPSVGRLHSAELNGIDGGPGPDWHDPRRPSLPAHGA